MHTKHSNLCGFEWNFKNNNKTTIAKHVKRDRGARERKRMKKFARYVVSLPEATKNSKSEIPTTQIELYNAGISAERKNTPTTIFFKKKTTNTKRFFVHLINMTSHEKTVNCCDQFQQYCNFFTKLI